MGIFSKKEKKESNEALLDEHKKNNTSDDEAVVDKPKRNLCPMQKKRFYRDKAIALRGIFIPLMILHVGFVVQDIIVYRIELLAAIFDLIMVWLCFYNYKVLDKYFIAGQIVLYLLAVLTALSHIERVILMVIEDWSANWLLASCFVIQFFVFYPLCAVKMIVPKLKAHFAQ